MGSFLKAVAEVKYNSTEDEPSKVGLYIPVSSIAFILNGTDVILKSDCPIMIRGGTLKNIEVSPGGFDEFLDLK